MLFRSGADPVFSGTARGMAHAVVRPRDAWWPAFQHEAGDAIADGLRRRVDADALARLVTAIPMEVPA
mgnify:FL=1